MSTWQPCAALKYDRCSEHTSAGYWGRCAHCGEGRRGTLRLLHVCPCCTLIQALGHEPLPAVHDAEGSCWHACPRNDIVCVPNKN